MQFCINLLRCSYVDQLLMSELPPESTKKKSFYTPNKWVPNYQFKPNLMRAIKHDSLTMKSPDFSLNWLLR